MCSTELRSLVSSLEYLVSNGRQVLLGGIRLDGSAIVGFYFSISQLHGEDGNVIGITGVVINAFGFTFYATYLVAKLDLAGYMGTRVSTISFTHHCININLN